MAELDIGSSVISDLKNQVKNYSVDTEALDSPLDQEETEWQNTNWNQWLAYYKKIPEFKTAINGYATWVIGKGWTADSRTTVTLDNIKGWGEDTFLSILWNMIVIKKVSGDAFAEIIRNDDGTLINLKPLDPGNIKIIVNRQGIIKRYEQISKTDDRRGKRFSPENILHLCNDRVADEIHGTSITEAVEWVILARNEAMDDWRTVLHRNINPLKIIYVDEDDSSKINAFRTKWQNMTKDKEVIFVPTGTVKVDIPSVALQDAQGWIKYLENFFYQALGVPKVILGGSEEFTEASSKIGYLTFEQVYSKEVTELKADLWNQLAIRVEFNKPASIKNELLQSGEKNQNQTGFQPSETTASLSRSE